MVGIGISIIGSGVVGQATGMGLYTHSRDLVFFVIDKRKLEDLRERRHTTAETLEAVERSNISMISVPTPTVDKRIDLSYVKVALDPLKSEAAQTKIEDKDWGKKTVRSTARGTPLNAGIASA